MQYSSIKSLIDAAFEARSSLLKGHLLRREEREKTADIIRSLAFSLAKSNAAARAMEQAVRDKYGPDGVVTLFAALKENDVENRVFSETYPEDQLFQNEAE